MNNFDYYAFQESLVKTKIIEEIKYYDDKDIVPRKYVEYLKKRVGMDDDAINNTYTKEKTSMNDYLANLENVSYQKPWIKLQDFHKRKKLEEFVNRLNYKNDDGKEKNRKKVLEKLCKGLDDKKYGKNKSVITYDMRKMQITNIDCVIYNKKSDSYKVLFR
jgi:hypothetical protein